MRESTLRGALIVMKFLCRSYRSVVGHPIERRREVPIGCSFFVKREPSAHWFNTCLRLFLEQWGFRDDGVVGAVDSNQSLICGMVAGHPFRFVSRR